MRHRIIIDRQQAILIACALLFAVLVAVEGWIWPLKLAAVIIPVTALLVS